MASTRIRTGRWSSRSPAPTFIATCPAGDAATVASMTWADRLVVLQDDARLHVPAALRDKVRVVYQSARTLVPWARKRADRLHCVLVAHLRDEKDPATAFGAWWRLGRRLSTRR